MGISIRLKGHILTRKGSGIKINLVFKKWKHSPVRRRNCPNQRKLKRTIIVCTRRSSRSKIWNISIKIIKLNQVARIGDSIFIVDIFICSINISIPKDI